MNYKHTQIGYLMIFTLFFVVILFWTILLQDDHNPNIFYIMWLVLFILSSFLSLKVVIDDTYLKIKFWYWIFRKSFLLSKIISVKIVKNHWYYWWGIRYWFWSNMTIYNISGFNAIEIKMENSKIYRIGTDEPEKLEKAILSIIKK